MVLGKVFNSLWHNLYAIGHIFIDENGQILKTQFGHLVTLAGIDSDENIASVLVLRMYDFSYNI